MIEPLSSLLRPTRLEDFVWQKELVWEDKPIRRYLEVGRIPSMIFWWFPWTGKTTLANIIAKKINARFYQMSGVTSKKAELIEILAKAKERFRLGVPTLIFLDEIHRWNKAQQDTLLPFVEKWIIILIWATTENPSFTVNNALLSRCKIFNFDKITSEDSKKFLTKNIKKIQDLHPNVEFGEKQIDFISNLSNGDLRNTLNILESLLIMRKKGKLKKSDILKAYEKSIYYDRNGEEHYNIISAVHKSLRDSDADAACYWIQRMLVWGEDPLYIARRLVRFASEDIWPADNNAIVLANTIYETVQKIGMPESDIFLFQLAIYLANAKKSNIVYKISNETKADIEKYGNLPVPLHLRNAPTKMMKDIWYGKNYKYAHDYKDAKIEQEHFPNKLKGRKYIK